MVRRVKCKGRPHVNRAYPRLGGSARQARNGITSADVARPHVRLSTGRHSVATGLQLTGLIADRSALLAEGQDHGIKACGGVIGDRSVGPVGKYGKGCRV